MFMKHEQFKIIEFEWVRYALQKLAMALYKHGINVDYGWNKDTQVKAKFIPDLLLHLKYNGRRDYWVVGDIKRNLRPFMMPLIMETANRIRSEGKWYIVISEYISKPLALVLREKGIWFVDNAGNVYIEIPGLLTLFVIGNTLKERFKHADSVITQSGAKLLLYFLMNGPEIITTYREIADNTGLSLGKVHYLMKSLKREGVVIGDRKKYYIRKPQNMLLKWTQAYLEKLKPKKMLGQFVSQFGEDVGQIHKMLKGKDVYFGGEFAAELLTGYLKSSRVDLWLSPEILESLRNELRLLRSKSGNIWIYVQWEGFPSQNSVQSIVPIPMLYADLLECGDQRCLETAEEIRKSYLSWTLMK